MVYVEAAMVIAIIVMFLVAGLWLWVRGTRKKADAGDGFVKRNWPKDDKDEAP